MDPRPQGIFEKAWSSTPRGRHHVKCTGAFKTHPSSISYRTSYPFAYCLPLKEAACHWYGSAVLICKDKKTRVPRPQGKTRSQVRDKGASQSLSTDSSTSRSTGTPNFTAPMRSGSTKRTSPETDFLSRAMASMSAEVSRSRGSSCGRP